MAAPKPRDYEICHYCNSHVVEHYRKHIHQLKCQKQFPMTKSVKCPYDSVHVVAEVEAHHHTSTCPRRHVLDEILFVSDDDFRPVVPVQPAPVVQCDENWDEEEYTSYKPDPWKNSHIIKKIKGATKSERRKARMEGVKSYRPSTTELDESI